MLAVGVDIGHTFITDVLELQLVDHSIRDTSGWWSVGYSLVEGAASALGIRRDDLDCALRSTPDGGWSVFIYDTVPGGAGHVVRIYEHLGTVLREAFSRVASCSCEETTSCYECLRTFGNQRLHGQLRRSVPRDFLARALGEPQPATTSDSLDLIQDRELRDVVAALVKSGMPVPEIGFELVDEQGRVTAEAEVAWPAQRVAVMASESAPRDSFAKDGWVTIASGGPRVGDELQGALSGKRLPTEPSATRQ